MRIFFRSYDASWRRTGWADRPQYSGQAGKTHDLPLACRTCGGSFVRVGLNLNSQLGPFGSYRADCDQGHRNFEAPIVDLLEAER